ncbi:MAG: hypothetical protein K9G59_05070 [Caulobacter sp.]|nr:hypothetical protein [Caulobacter sp.]
MAPYLLVLALLFQDGSAAAASDAPVATAVPRKQDVAPLPIQGGAVTAPTDDYGYVGWCYGAISAYVDLYDRAMPEVIRIERAWPTPSTEENIAVIYPEQREEAKRNLALFASAMEAAEKASPTPIQPQGAAAIKRGRAVWMGATNVPKAQLAQFWMSWSPPAKCTETAKTLETRSLLFGQVLTYNAKGATPIVAPPPPADESAEPAPPVDPMASGPVEGAPDAPAAAADTPLADPAVAANDALIEQPAAAPDAASSTAIDDLLPTEEAAATPVVAEPETPPAAVAPATPAITAAPGATPTPATTVPPAEAPQDLRGPQ